MYTYLYTASLFGVAGKVFIRSVRHGVLRDGPPPADSLCGGLLPVGFQQGD